MRSDTQPLYSLTVVLVKFQHTYNNVISHLNFTFEVSELLCLPASPMCARQSHKKCQYNHLQQLFWTSSSWYNHKASLYMHDHTQHTYVHYHHDIKLSQVFQSKTPQKLQVYTSKTSDATKNVWMLRGKLQMSGRRYSSSDSLALF